ncbi:cocaine esterase-like [Aplysia californica]|uniref:Carboxylic ester hydrolase n=1 Tax=Aplysia californica TaxID=6500 RepID=A0ABM0K0V2_APLCA|nr:cocaine esterase-like [Aplysia californica]
MDVTFRVPDSQKTSHSVFGNVKPISDQTDNVTSDILRRPSTVKTQFGEVSGVLSTVNGTQILQFLGLPFAKPPVGQRRFAAPEPPEKWTGIRDGSHFGNECLQNYLTSRAYENRTRGEDCLNLNIYSPSTSTNSAPLPVMVWIHGGNYYIGAGSRYDGSALAAKDVIVVTLNYRLDVFGFLSSEDNVIPGNYGLLDQLQALKWVKENIADFGGDPHQVTVFGESSGSGATSLLVLSPLSKGLFHRAIMQSGVSLSPWVVDHPAVRMSPRIMTNLIGGLVGCTQWDAHKRLACLRRVDAEFLHDATRNVTWNADAGTVMSPRVENVFGVLPDLPVRMLARGEFNKVDTIHGYTADEEGGTISDPDNNGLTRDEFRKNLLSAFRPYAFTDQDNLIREMANLYLGNSSDPFYIRAQTLRARSDFSVIGATLNEIQMIVNKDSTKKHYLYNFKYRPSFSYAPNYQNATHFQDVSFVFGVDLKASQLLGGVPNDADRAVSDQVLTMWTNFAKTGDPTSPMPQNAMKWGVFTKASPKFITIDSASFVSVFKDFKYSDFYRKITQKLDTVEDFSGAIVG